MSKERTIVAQLSSVHSPPENLEPDYVLRYIGSITNNVPIDILALGWDERPELFSRLTSIDERLTKNVYLWYPFLSDFPGFHSSHLVVNINSRKSSGWSGYDGTGIKETFKQACPNNVHAVSTSLKHLECLLSAYNFDGVFIDKIRFPSMVNGLQDVFSCFCSFCMDAAAQTGLDLNQVRVSLLEKGQLELRCQASDIPNGSVWLETLVKDKPLLQQFIRFRADSINKVVKVIAERVNLLGKKMSLDVFSPSLAPLVGQDFTFMGQYAEWVKPMIYRYGNGPSSLRSEIPALVRELGGFYNLEIDDVMNWVGEYVDGLHGVPLVEIEKVAPLSLVQAETYSAVRLLPDTPLYLGLETVSIPPVMTIHPHNVEEILEIGETAGVQGYVLSWDLLHTPLENVLPLKALL